MNEAESPQDTHFPTYKAAGWSSVEGGCELREYEITASRLWGEKEQR